MQDSQAYSQFERNDSAGFNLLHLDDIKFVRFARSGAVLVAISSLLLPLLSFASILGEEHPRAHCFPCSLARPSHAAERTVPRPLLPPLLPPLYFQTQLLLLLLLLLHQL